jgi:hypothetical protein
MPSDIFDSGQMSLTALNVPGVYVDVLPDQTVATSVPQSNILLLVGTAGWGRTNSPMLTSSTTDVGNAIGGITAASITDPYDLARAASQAYQQAQGNGSLQVYLLRATDGTDTKATLMLSDTEMTPVHGATLTAIFSGSLGDGISVNISAGNLLNTFNATITSFNGAQELFQNIPGSGSTFWANFVSAINNGQTNLRGPSQLVTAATTGSPTAGPALGTFSLTGGTDGRGVTTSQIIGTDSTNGTPTGMYAGRSLTPAPAAIAFPGMTDDTQWANISAFVEQEAMQTVLAFPTGTTTSAAVSGKQNQGINSYLIALAKDWVFWQDTVNGVLELCDPVPFILGLHCSLSPEQSILAYQVQGVVGSERYSPTQGIQPYQDAEVGLLHDNGILFITNPAAPGVFWGFRHDRSTSTDPVRSPMNFGRMRNFVARLLQATGRRFIGQVQGNTNADKLRTQVKSALDTSCQSISSIIDGFQNSCTQQMNPQSSVILGYLYALTAVAFLRTVEFFVINFQGGSDVTVTSPNSTSTNVSA